MSGKGKGKAKRGPSLGEQLVALMAAMPEADRLKCQFALLLVAQVMGAVTPLLVALVEAAQGEGGAPRPAPPPAAPPRRRARSD